VVLTVPEVSVSEVSVSEVSVSVVSVSEVSVSVVSVVWATGWSPLAGVDGFAAKAMPAVRIKTTRLIQRGRRRRNAEFTIVRLPDGGSCTA
jgi:hypothetical protein